VENIYIKIVTILSNTYFGAPHYTTQIFFGVLQYFGIFRRQTGARFWTEWHPAFHTLGTNFKRNDTDWQRLKNKCWKLYTFYIVSKSVRSYDNFICVLTPSRERERAKFLFKYQDRTAQ